MANQHKVFSKYISSGPGDCGVRAGDLGFGPYQT